MAGPARKRDRGERLHRVWWASRWVVNLLLLALVVVFILQNREPVTVRVLVPIVQMPQWVALTLTLVVGAAIGFLSGRRR